MLSIIFIVQYLYSNRYSHDSAMTNSNNNSIISNSNNDQMSNFNTTNYTKRVHNQLASTPTSPSRRSWTTYAFKNKNFPDGKLSYEQNFNNNNSNNNFNSLNHGGAYTKMYSHENSSESSTKFSQNYNKFERNQDVMALASQIVM